MIIVIIAGGSGTRLWPLSTSNYPKHLLSLMNERSLLQNTYDRVRALADDEDIVVVSEASHVKHVYKQLPQLKRKNILVEPARRGTASCVVWALSEIKKRKYEDQPVLFLWADHLIRDRNEFIASAKQASKLAIKHKKLIFMGVEPSYPSTGMGYIHKGDRLKNGFKNVFELKQFVEKPDKATANQYFQSGDYLWNMGYLTGTMSTFEREFKDHAPRLWDNYQLLLNSWKVKKIYMDFKSEPIDTALSEHVPDALVVAGSFDWVDVGSFQDLHDASLQNDEGNHVKGDNIELENVTNSYVRNEQGVPVAVIGLDNVAVIATEAGFLVTNKTHAQKVGDISKRLQK
jgi:mannose-1-phosphate guanylyltransferase/mannose-6-phosphate isomerase